MILTFDIGNSQIKWAQWRSGAILCNGGFSSDWCALSAFMAKYHADNQSPEKVFAVCVGGNELGDELDRIVISCWGYTVDFFHTTRTFSGRNVTLSNAYEDVSCHGSDRWAGLIAASHEFDGPLCVIGAGTAITADLLDVDGHHLGGRILPSFYSMYSALVKNAAAIEKKTGQKGELTGRRSEEMPPPVLFANTTENAITSGIYYMLETGVRDLTEKAIKQLGPSAKIILTGGSAQLLLQFKNMPHFIYRPVLVMRGVYIALGEKNGAPVMLSQ